MKLTWRDGVTTLIVAAIIGLYYAMTRGVEIPLIGSLLTAIVVTGVLAIVMGLVGMEERDVEEEGWLGNIIAFGLVGAVIFVASLVYTTEVMFLALTVGIVAFWGVGMLHHIVSRSAHVGAPV